MARRRPGEMADRPVPAVAASEAGADQASSTRDVRAIELPIVTVTLLEDRAHVVRRGNLALARARERVRVERIAPVASDRTLAVSVVEDSGVAVVDARIRRRAVVRVRDADVSSPSDVAAERDALERERDELRQTMTALGAEREVSTRQATALERAAVLALTELAEDVSWGNGPELAWTERLDSLAAEQRDLGQRRVHLDRELERLEAVLARLGERIAALDGPAEEERADLEIDLQGAAGAACVLRVDYAVPGACWRPCHTARLRAREKDGDGGPGGAAGQPGLAEVLFDTDACVWQNTGEDWREAELVFSTARVSRGVEPPRLSSDMLRSVKRSEAVAVEAREQEIDTTGLGMSTDAAARAVSAELPGVDDAGEVQTWRAAEKATIPSDGRPYRVRLGSFRSESEVELVAFPELAASALLKSRQENRGSGPLLAGPVELVRESGLCGRTSIRYIAPGERFELGWGPDPDLRVSREAEALDEKGRVLSAWSVRRTLVRIKLSNLGGETRQLSVTERLPVSEVEKVRVSVDPERVSGRRRPDENGFLRWSVTLAPFGHEELEVVWELRRHEDVTGV